MNNLNEHLTPNQVVEALDRFIVGQKEAKRAVAIAIRNRWRRMHVDEKVQAEILPKNILMVGPTGVGKTEIARRLADLTDAPFLKVEASKYTEVGYVGRDVEQMIRDLLEIAITRLRQQMRYQVREQARHNAENRALIALVGEQASDDTRKRFLTMLRDGNLDDREINIETKESKGSNIPTFDIPGAHNAQMGVLNINDAFSKMFGEKSVTKTMTVEAAFKVLLDEESDQLLDEDIIVRNAITSVEQNGIIFLDEIDKICARKTHETGGDISREGVQRDLLPLIEGTTVSTRHGMVSTNHILFIASGAFHLVKPSDLMPELQGRLPVRVRLNALGEKDFIRILTEPENSLTKQYQWLIGTEGISLHFKPGAITAIAALSAQMNSSMENIGARRLHTILEKVLEAISFIGPDYDKKEYIVTEDYVRSTIGALLEKSDLKRFIL